MAAAAAFIEETWTAQGYLVSRQWPEAHGLRWANPEVTRAARDRVLERIAGKSLEAPRQSPDGDSLIIT